MKIFDITVSTELCVFRGSVQLYDRSCASDKHPVASCMQQSVLQVIPTAYIPTSLTG